MTLMGPKLKKRLKFAGRWGVAVVGIIYVLSNIRFHDRVRLLDAKTLQIQEVRVWNQAKDDDAEMVVSDPASGQQVTIPRARLWTLPDGKTVDLADPAAEDRKTSAKLLAVQPAGRGAHARTPATLLIERTDTHQRAIVDPATVVGSYHPTVSYPLVEIGVNRMAAEADWKFLLAAIFVLPVSYLLTSYRWHLLLEALDIHIGMARTFVINMVGAFYNSFMPGSTGGDLIKAWYAAKHTDHRTRAVLSVIVDRIVGLLALILLGGALAAFQWVVPECRKVAVVSGAALLATVGGLCVFYHPTWRRVAGLDWILKKLPMQRQVNQAVHAMELYGRRPGVMAWAFLSAFPVHITTILSATLAGMAFHLPLPGLYYWVIVPVIALVGAVPISPQGVGVQEYFAVQLTQHRGATIAQAAALVMSIRLMQMFWNLVAGLFVLRGGYHAPTASEQHQLEQDDEGDAHVMPIEALSARPVDATVDLTPSGA